ncbi:MAG: flagellar export protein FliJ [Acidobacteriia bacterium]|nr:flagellar export protein FliJ [Terriglobia bacterium]
MSSASLTAPFKYRLQKLLDLKLERKEELQRDLAQRLAELAAEQKAHQELEAARARMEEKLASLKRVPLGMSGLAIQQYRDYLRGLVMDVEATRDAEFSQRLRVQEFAENVAKARRVLAECSRELEVLNKHRDRLEKRFLKEAERKEAADQDEIGSMLFSRGRGSTR